MMATPADAAILPLRLSAACYEAGGTLLIDGLSFLLHAGPRTILLGPNGAGKSLTLRLCHGLLQPTSGWLAWQGPGAASAPLRQAMVFQRPVMLRRSAAANVGYALSLRAVSRKERRELVAEALETAGLSAVAGRAARVLSIGEQQRLALARAWALRPEVLFLDEPTANLDPASTRAVEELINAIHEAGTKIVMTTHDLGQARRLADEILFLHRGLLIERAPAGRFFSAPQSREARAFIAGELLW
jgi:tungstate transport system ATP-binding protein